MRLHKNIMASIATFLACTAVHADPLCSADLTGDGWVDQQDLGVLLASYGINNGGDIDGDGDTDQSDLGALLAEYGTQVVFDFGPDYDDDEAVQIGLEILGPNGSLLLAQEDYDRIDRDLGLIRAFEPRLAGEPHSMAWAPNQLLIGRNDDGDLQEYACLNEYYQITDEDLISSGLNLWLLTYAAKMNIPALGQIYDDLSAVNYAEPNYLIGGQNFYEPMSVGGGVWQWDIDDGFTDCFDGCDCHRYYILETYDDGTVILIDYQEVGQPWCDFGP